MTCVSGPVAESGGERPVRRRRGLGGDEGAWGRVTEAARGGVRMGLEASEGARAARGCEKRPGVSRGPCSGRCSAHADLLSAFVRRRLPCSHQGPRVPDTAAGREEPGLVAPTRPGVLGAQPAQLLQQVAPGSGPSCGEVAASSATRRPGGGSKGPGGGTRVGLVRERERRVGHCGRPVERADRSGVCSGGGRASQLLSDGLGAKISTEDVDGESFGRKGWETFEDPHSRGMGAALGAFALGPAEDGVKGQAGRGREAGGKAAGAGGVEVAWMRQDLQGTKNTSSFQKTRTSMRSR